MCCGDCGGCLGSLAYLAEKLVSFAAMTAVIVCIIITVVFSIGLGVGLGYNYCYVDLRVIKENSDDGDGYGLLLRSATNTSEKYVTDPNPSTTSEDLRRMLPNMQQTLAIPLNGNLDISSLISKLRGHNRNVTLELIT